MVWIPPHLDGLSSNFFDLCARTASDDKSFRSIVSEFAAAIAYKVNQPLAAITINGEASIHWLSQEPPDLDKARSLAECMLSDARRAAAIIAELYSLVQLQSTDAVRVDLNELIHGAARVLRENVPLLGISVELDLVPGLPSVVADSVKLQQAVVDLAIGTFEAMNERGSMPRRLIIRTRLINPETLCAELEYSDQICGSVGTERPLARPSYGSTRNIDACRSAIAVYGGRIDTTPRSEAGGVRHCLTLPTATTVDPTLGQDF